MNTNNNYYKELIKSINCINTSELEKAKKKFIATCKSNNFIFCCGNGGSASISNHFQVDALKGVYERKKIKSKFISLSSNIETITAISNDIGYDKIFEYQLRIYSKKNRDLLICISSSGNSKNIINAITYAKKNKIFTISLTGFDGGLASKLSNINLHVKSDNYGVIEDTHQSIMHFITQI
jgi:D-sedoheptulose 7-phosphate isomerase